MSKKKKNKGGKKIVKDEVKKIKINSRQDLIEIPEEGETLEDFEKQKKEKGKFQNLVSALILVAGLFAGSLFVDVAQFITKKGYSERALREAEVFELGDKTWVAYDEPVIKVDILVTENEEDCPTCSADEILIWMKKFIPTMVINEISEGSQEGKSLIKKFQLKTIPSFVFDGKIQEASFFKDEQVQETFERKKDGFILNSTALGIPAGKYLEAPEEKDGDIIIGDKEAKVKIVTFFDFQCPYSKIFYDIMSEVTDEFKEQELGIVYKSFPLDLNGQAISAALTGQCAYQQGMFKEMADLLFENQKEWGSLEDFKIFNKYAEKIGLNKKEFNECIDSEKNRNLIQELIDQGDQFGVAGTPASFIGKEFLNGILQKGDIIETVRKNLE